MASAEVGQTLEVQWPSGDTSIDITATVRDVEKSEKMKHGSQYVYTLDCNDGQVRKTRLLNLKWSLVDNKRQRKNKNKDSSDQTQSTLDETAESKTQSTPQKTSSTEDANDKKKKKARWTDGRNASKDTVEKSIYVRQIPYAASAKDIERHFSNCSNVRLLKDEKTKKSRGIAFVEFPTNEDATNALGLHGSIMQGRPISVTKCVDSETARSQDKSRLEAKAKALAEAAAAGTQSLAEVSSAGDNDANKLDLDIIKNLTSNCVRSSHGAISSNDFDSRSIEFMRTLSEDMLKAALVEFASIPLIKDKKVANKASYLMGVLKRFQEGKARPKKGEGSTANDSTNKSSSSSLKRKSEGSADETKPKKLNVIASSSVEIETCITNAILQSEGKLSRSDFDARHVSFLQELPLETASAACDEFSTYHKLSELRNKGSYFMGILRRHANGEDAPPPKSSYFDNSGKGKGKGGKGSDFGGKGKGGKGKGGKGKGGKGKGGKGKGKGKGKGSH